MIIRPSSISARIAASVSSSVHPLSLFRPEMSFAAESDAAAFFIEAPGWKETHLVISLSPALMYPSGTHAEHARHSRCSVS